MNKFQKVLKRVSSDGIFKAGSYYSRAIFSALLRSINEIWLENKRNTYGNDLARTWPSTTYQDRTLSYVESLRVKNGPYGRYRYSTQNNRPTLYASTYAALVRHLYGELQGIDQSLKEEWIEYLSSHQSDDGLFRDSAVANEIAETDDWWGWRHLTIHVLGALAALGGQAKKRFLILEKLHPPGQVDDWLGSLDWDDNADFASNAVQNIGSMLQYARDFQEDDLADDTLNQMMDWLDQHQDPQTGLWGKEFNNPKLLSKGVQAAYHIILLYFYDRRPIQYKNKLIDSLLATQNRLGGFGTRKSSSACEDIDSIDPLTRFLQLSQYRREDIKEALNRAIPWVLTNMNEDGGFVFFRGASYTYGHELLSSKIDQSALFPTWFRTLSLAYLDQCAPDITTENMDWQFINCPGYQFWNNS